MPRVVHLLLLLLLLSALAPASALRVMSSTRKGSSFSPSRRQLFSSAAALTLLRTADAAFATGNMPAVQGEVSKMEQKKKVSTPEEAKAQIVAGYTALGNLLDTFDSVTSSGGGDGVRRALGVVGTDSPVYLIEPAFRLLFEADDTLPMEYIDTLEKLMQNLSSADSEAYSAIFIEFSSAKGKPEDYFKRSKAAVVRARTEWKTMMDYLKLVA